MSAFNPGHLSGRIHVQIGFLSNCSHTLLVQLGVSVSGSKGCNVISLGTALIQIRSFMMMLFALIILPRDRKPFSSGTCKSLTFINFLSEIAFQCLLLTSTCTFTVSEVQTEVEFLHTFLACGLVLLVRGCEPHQTYDLCCISFKVPASPALAVSRLSQDPRDWSCDPTPSFRVRSNPRSFR